MHIAFPLAHLPRPPDFRNAGLAFPRIVAKYSSGGVLGLDRIQWVIGETIVNRGVKKRRRGQFESEEWGLGLALSDVQPAQVWQEGGS